MLISAFVLIGSYQLPKLSIWQRRGHGVGCLAYRTVFKLGDNVKPKLRPGETKIFVQYNICHAQHRVSKGLNICW